MTQTAMLKCAFLLAVATSFSLHTSVSHCDSDWPQLTGPYLGQNPPGKAAEIFAPGIISTDASEINSVFSPEGDEFYFTAWIPETGTKIMVTRLSDRLWSKPKAASFSTHPTDVDPAFSHDGKRLFFSSRRPRPGEAEVREAGFDLWFADRTAAGWSEAQYLGPVVNSGESQVYSTVTQTGALYFQSVRKDGYGKADSYRSRRVGGVYQAPENLGPVINSENYEGDIYIARDESYLVVSVNGRQDSLGGADLYVSFRGRDDSWTPLKNLGSAVNSDQRDFCPMVSPDDKYLFFSSKRAGEGDIFWVDASVIQQARGRLGHFNPGQDLFLPQFDSKTDVDDLHSVAGVATMLRDPRFSEVNYHAVAGAYGIQEGLYVPAPGLFNLAFGARWSNAHEDREGALAEVSKLVAETLNNGGHVWVAEAGQSDFTADWLKLVRERHPSVVTEELVHVVQHSDWNESVTSPESLAYVKQYADYQKIPDGNELDNGTPGLRTESGAYWHIALGSAGNGESWSLARDIAMQYNGRDGRYNNDAIAVGGMDFSDVSESCWIFGFSDIRGTESFFAEFLSAQ